MYECETSFVTDRKYKEEKRGSYIDCECVRTQR